MEVERGAEYFDYLAGLPYTRRYRVLLIWNMRLHKPNSGKNPRRGHQPSSWSFYRGLQRGKGSRANPAKRFVREKEEQRNGRDLPLAAGRGMWSLFRRKSPFAILSFDRQRRFLSHAEKESGVETRPARYARG